MGLILGLDIGTTTIKAILYNSEQGSIISASSRPTPTVHPQPGWSEHDPRELWQAVIDCIRESCAGQAPSALAISSMAETGMLVDAQGRTLSPVIAWYDRRSEPQASWIEQQVRMDRLYRITGQRASPSFAIAKLLWLREHLLRLLITQSNGCRFRHIFFTGCAAIRRLIIPSLRAPWFLTSARWIGPVNCARLLGSRRRCFPPLHQEARW